MLRHLLGLTEAETARELAISIGTVKSHNARALTRLRTLLTGATSFPGEKWTHIRDDWWFFRAHDD